MACKHAEELDDFIQNVGSRDSALTILARLRRLERDWRFSRKGERA